MDKKKNNEPEKNQAEDMNFDYSKIDFDALDDSGKKEAYEKVIKHNAFLLKLSELLDKECGELKAKAEGKVSDETYKRLMADYENFKRRNELAKSQSYNDGIAEVLFEVIKITDNFEIAIKMIPDDSVREGVEKIAKLFTDLLAKFNVKEIEALGCEFDPKLHNCIMQGEAENPEQADKVIEVFQKGYTYSDRVLRHSVVKVAK